ncbi:sulfotransferase [Pseudophaeobacter sp.]|uniref:sulfotransferase n=1 Tax=Pseudophaeobacter sp. TaxID=1971739 RepID=UPI00329906E9
MPLDSYRYIFIVTYARSGSTLLMSLLNHCDGTCIRGENRATLYHLYRATEALRDTFRRGQSGRQEERDRPWFGAHEVRPARFRRQLLASFVSAGLNPPPGTRITGCKEIRHHHPFHDDADFAAYIAFLLENFPGAKIVFNSRDLGAVRQSAWLKNRPPKQVETMVKTCERRFKAAQAAHPAQCFWVDYDAFTAQPQRYGALFEFLDLPYDPKRIAQVLHKTLDHQPQK